MITGQSFAYARTGDVLEVFCGDGYQRRVHRDGRRSQTFLSREGLVTNHDRPREGRVRNLPFYFLSNSNSRKDCHRPWIEQSQYGVGRRPVAQPGRAACTQVAGSNPVRVVPNISVYLMRLYEPKRLWASYTPSQEPRFADTSRCYGHVGFWGAIW